MLRDWFSEFPRKSLAMAASLLLVASLAFGQDCSRPQAYAVQGYAAPSCSAPGPVSPSAYGYAPQQYGGFVDTAIDAAVGRFVQNYELKFAIEPRRSADVGYAVPSVTYGAPMVYAAPPVYSTTIVSAPPVVAPQTFYVPATGQYTTGVVASPFSPTGYAAPVMAPMAPVRPPVAAGYRHYHYRATPAGAVRVNAWN